MPTRIKNQAIKLYDSSETLFNNKTSKYEWHEDYFPTVTCDDTSQIIINSDEFIEDTGADSGFDFVVPGSITAGIGLTSTVTDSNATFITDGVEVGMFFMMYDGTTVSNGTLISRKIISVDSETQLTVDSNYSSAISHYYEVSNWRYSGDIRTVNGYAEFDDDAGLLVKASSIKTAIKNGSVYKVQLTITFINPDAPASMMTLRLGSNKVLVVFAEDIEAREYVAYGVSNGDELTLGLEGEPELNIDNIIITEMYNTSFKIRDCLDDSIKYSSVNDDFVFSDISNQLKMSIDWANAVSGYECSGCFYIDVDQTTDQDEDLDRITGDFNNASEWTEVGGNWVFGSSEVTLSGGNPDESISQIGSQLVSPFTKGVNYTISFNITSFDNGQFDVILLNGGVELMNLGTFTTVGLKSIETGILSSKADEFKIVSSGGGSTEFTMESLDAIKNTVDPQYSYRTDCFNLTSETNGTIKLSGSNLDNAFGIDFIELSYRPFLRVQGELLTPKWSGEKENEEDSAGVSNTLFFKSETERDLFLYQLPEFHHEFIRLLIGYDSFFVDDIEYVAKSSDYEPENERILGKLPDLSNSTTQLRLKDDLNVNKFC